MNVTLDWMGCATFRLTLGDLVIFLDAYIDRVPSAVPIGITAVLDRLGGKIQRNRGNFLASYPDSDKASKQLCKHVDNR